MRRNEVDNLDNRARIMECAVDLFYTQGYDATGVKEIADRAGITKPTLYYYFGSKIGLLKEILEESFTKILPELEKVRDPGKDIRQNLYEAAEFYRQLFMREHELYMMLMTLFYSARESETFRTVEPYLNRFYATIVKIFEDHADSLGNMRGRQRQFALSFIGALNMLLMAADHKEQVSRECVRQLVDQFMYGIFS